MTEHPAEIPVTVTSLEMRARPPLGVVRPPVLAHPVMMLRATRPTLAFYRFLYNTVGQDWLWYERRLIDDAALAAIIHDPAVAVTVLYVGGVPAGYVEIDARQSRDVEIAYLGLMPDFIGRGLGRFLINWAVDAAWENTPERVWIHTCDLDHPAALHLYQKAGFVPFRQETTRIANPRRLPSFAEAASAAPGERQPDPGADQ